MLIFEVLRRGMAEERIMSVELAIKRELAYREKLARQYPEYDWKKEFLPLEVIMETCLLCAALSVFCYCITVPSLCCFVCDSAVVEIAFISGLSSCVCLEF